ncbi:cation:proton antiporter [Ammoniphilus oxalaticus]|uniref:Cation:proton antiporter n=1 Tax=Ammoniphilus oxalaticus TaxID=66863 RepID=A0A419SKH8_9BACL|nr:Na+/H+ antiporter subunit E [Ammoniphilus oxalaticus]RKD24497.1 cation:proton antiporter [Ammoniphilus oxalaticus]
MALQILLNFSLAFVWMFLNDDWSPTAMIIGFLLGLGMMYIFRRFFKGGFYFRKVIAVMKLLLIFMRELVLSTWSVIKVVLSPKMDLRPGIFALPTQLKSDVEITLLASLITLTPGTLTLKVSDDGQTLYIHAMDLSDRDEAIAQIQNTFEKAIMEVTR